MPRKFLSIPAVVIFLGISLALGGGVVVASIFFGGDSINLQKGLVGYWDFGAGSTTTATPDRTPNNNDGVVTEATLTTDRKGQSNKAYSFDGTDDYIEVDDTNSNFTGDKTQALTIAAWIKPTVVSGAQGIASKDIAAPYAPRWVFRVNNTKLYFSSSRAGNETLSNSALTAGVWSHVAATWVSGTVKLYINGVLDKEESIALDGFLAEPGWLHIGRIYANTWVSPFGGPIDDVRFYNRVLPLAEITALYESYSPGIVMSDLQKGLVGQWKMDGNAKDSTPNSNHGTLAGAAGANNLPQLTTDRKGQSNKAYSFDGTDDYIDAGTGASLALTGNMSFGFWVNPTGTDANKDIISKAAYTVDGFEVYLEYSAPVHRIMLRTSQAAAAQTSSTSVGVGVTVGSYSHVVVTRSGATTLFYINGAVVASGGVSNLDPVANLTRNLILGKASINNAALNGMLDDVRIYSRALSATEVTALYESYNPGIVVSDLQKGLVGQWKMDGNAKDSTPYSNNGTVTGATLVNDRKGQALKSYSFNGTTDYINLGSSIPTTGDITVSMWINSPGGNNKTILSNNDGVIGNGLFADVNINEATIRFFYNPVDGYYNVDITLLPNIWQNIVFTFNASSGISSMYSQGVFVTSSSVKTATVRAVQNLLLGARPDLGPGRFFGGILDEVRVYNRALSAAEILALYESYR